MEINDVMKSLGISKNLANELDEIDGKDNQISESVFSMAQKILNNPNEYLDLKPNMEFSTDTTFMLVRDAFVREKENNKKEVEKNEITLEDIDKWTSKKISKEKLDEMRAKAKDYLESANSLVKLHKASHPTSNYEVDFTGFPTPERFETYKKKNILNEFEKELFRWLDKIEDDLFLNIGEQKEKIHERLDNINTQIEGLNENIKKEGELTRSTTKDVVQEVAIQIDEHVQGIHENIDNSERNIKNAVMDAKIEVADVVTAESKRTNENIDKVNQNIDKKSEEIEEINALSDAISSAISVTEGKTIFGFGDTSKEHRDKIIEEVEKLKSNIINSKIISHQEKVRLLTKLRDLVINDEWITKKELKELLQETSQINL